MIKEYYKEQSIVRRLALRFRKAIDEEFEKPPKSISVMQFDADGGGYWMDVGGNLHDVESESHKEWAQHYYEDADRLFAEGWLRVISSDQTVWWQGMKATAAQMRKLKDVAAFHHLDLSRDRRLALRFRKATDGPHDYSCTMLSVPKEVRAIFEELLYNVDDKDLAGDGKEDDPHITVKYGTHTSNIKDIIEVLKDSGIKEVSFKLGKLSTFPPSEHSDDAAVLKFDIESEDLLKLNKDISEALKSTDSFPEYHPHLTLCYLKPSLAEKYVKSLSEDLTNAKDEFSSSILTFSNQDGDKTKMDLRRL